MQFVSHHVINHDHQSHKKKTFLDSEYHPHVYKQKRGNHFYDDLHFGQDAVMPEQVKGYVHVHYSSWIDEDMFLLDTIVKVNPVPVNMRNSIGFIH